MSLENTSHPGRPGSDELVPSRYALRVGEIDVLVISDGVFPLPAATLATNADPAELAAWLDDRLQPPDVFKWPLNVVVVRSGGRTVLIDAGVGAEFPDFPQVGQLAMRLDAAGIDPASVTDVVLTHLHVDHVGGLLADGLRGRLRPDVPIHLAAAEVEFWASPDFSRNTFGGFPDVLRSAEERFVDVYRSQLRPFEAEYEVAAGGDRPSHQRPHPRAQRGPPGVRRRPADVPRRCRVPEPLRPPRLAQRFRPRPRGGGPRPGPSLAGAGGDPRALCGRSPVVPVRRPGGGRRRRLSFCTGRLGVLTACWVRAEPGAAPDRGRKAGPGR
jgi:glyoxylase-like metal-dependent hydrolase (beta-lactamase superfamily II)